MHLGNTNDKKPEERKINDEEDNNLFKLAIVISYIFQSKIKEGEMVGKNAKNPRTYFEVTEAPSLSIKDYLFHLVSSLKSHPATLILMVIYIERLMQSLSNYVYGEGHPFPFFMTMNNAHKIVLTALIIAHKYSMDISYPFKVLSKIVGVSISELKILEYEFLFFLKYELFVSEDLYSQFEQTLNLWPGITKEQLLLEQERLGQRIAFQALCASNSEETQENDEDTTAEKDKYDMSFESKINTEDGVKIKTIHFAQNKPNPSSRHDKPCFDTFPHLNDQNKNEVINLYEHDQDESERDSYYPDTEMTIVNEEDLGVDDIQEDVVIWNQNISSTPPFQYYLI